MKKVYALIVGWNCEGSSLAGIFTSEKRILDYIKINYPKFTYYKNDMAWLPEKCLDDQPDYICVDIWILNGGYIGSELDESKIVAGVL